ncbi:TPA: 50S ribosomal protein L3 [Candidatus Pacearchaeota archaeon]|jgi:large subunit ribosomal protein L3|nr:50S ribosomal protein L3 [Candidatus Pacearchaeota archaeon]
MPTRVRPRFGSLQFWPRKRARKYLPSVNWKPINSEGILGFITYKVGMCTALVKDNTADSMTKGKKISIPITILAAPNMKIFSVRFYKKGKVVKDFIVSNEKILKKRVKIPKQIKELGDFNDFDDIRFIAYSLPKETGIKKKPDFIELGVNSDDKLLFIKNFIGKEITLQDMLKGNLLDVRGLTKGKGLSGPVKRFGITLKSHKSEKGRRNPGSIGPWHPAHVNFRVPMSGQLGMFTRVHYNLKVLDSGNISEKSFKDFNFRKYGKLTGNYIILEGSVQGPSRRQILVTAPIRPSKKQIKKDHEFLEMLK